MIEITRICPVCGKEFTFESKFHVSIRIYCSKYCQQHTDAAKLSKQESERRRNAIKSAVRKDSYIPCKCGCGEMVNTYNGRMFVSPLHVTRYWRVNNPEKFKESNLKSRQKKLGDRVVPSPKVTEENPKGYSRAGQGTQNLSTNDLKMKSKQDLLFMATQYADYNPRRPEIYIARVIAEMEARA